MRGTDMLLAEGMNVKVLLLPDGDDPDSFSKKHSAAELKDYIEKNQTDFIAFKTRLTVENVTDHVKRSEAIGGIVKSISVIPDQILRSTYLSELSLRMGIKEQTLLNSMNGMIRKDIEDKEKELRNEKPETRNDDGSQGENQEQGNQHSSFLIPHSSLNNEVERLLIQAVVRYGEEIIFDDVETEDGEKISLNVAEYISYDLGQDGIHFHDERFNRILDEAVAHGREEGFKAESYFEHHPDVQISHLATQLAVDRHQLGKGFQVKKREGSLRQHVLHLVLDLRMDIIEARLKEIQTQIRQVGNDMERVRELMGELKDVQELRNALAKQLGNDVVA